MIQAKHIARAASSIAAGSSDGRHRDLMNPNPVCNTKGNHTPMPRMCLRMTASTC